MPISRRLFPCQMRTRRAEEHPFPHGPCLSSSPVRPCRHRVSFQTALGILDCFACVDIGTPEATCFEPGGKIRLCSRATGVRESINMWLGALQGFWRWYVLCCARCGWPAEGPTAAAAELSQLHHRHAASLTEGAWSRPQSLKNPRRSWLRL